MEYKEELDMHVVPWLGVDEGTFKDQGNCDSKMGAFCKT